MALGQVNRIREQGDDMSKKPGDIEFIVLVILAFVAGVGIAFWIMA